jgi:hypothetical protein
MNENLFQSELLSDEKILWLAQPETSVIFSKSDIFLIPFSIFWGGFALLWEGGALMASTDVTESGPIDLLFPLFGIPFVVIGLYFMIGRFWYKAKKKKHTYYALTNKRILILTNLFGKRFEGIYVNTLPVIQKSVRSDGIGNLVFGNTNFQGSMYANSGMDWFSNALVGAAPAFYDIKDVETVYSKIAALRNDQ